MPSDKLMHGRPATETAVMIDDDNGDLEIDLLELMYRMLEKIKWIIAFALVGMLWLTKRKNGEEEYINVWPSKLDLDDYAYRPALKGLAFIGAVAARCVETLAAILVMGPVNLIFTGAEKEVIPPEDEEFSKYDTTSDRSLVQRSFNFDLLCAALGVAALMVFVLINL